MSSVRKKRFVTSDEDSFDDSPRQKKQKKQKQKEKAKK
jgi:hypothetical protein